MEKSERQWVQTLENKVTQLEAKIACLKNEITARDYELREEIAKRSIVSGKYSESELEAVEHAISDSVSFLARLLNRTENSVIWQMRRTIVNLTGSRVYETK